MLEMAGERGIMILKFSSKAKKLKRAWEQNDFEKLIAEYDRDTAECLADLMNILSAASSLHDVMGFSQYRPHPIECGRVLSLSLIGRKRMTVRTIGSDGKPTKRLDFSVGTGLILEVSEHYGD